MTNTRTSRRTILAGLAAAPALGTFGAGHAAPIPDPILAVIEAHKITYRRMQEAGSVSSNMVSAPSAKGYDAAALEAATEADSDAVDANLYAADALIETTPTTMAGVLALLDYVEAFNAGAFALPADPEGWRSSAGAWPATVDDDDVEVFGFALLSNVRRALASMAGAA